jgi:hypothetical protein
VLAHTLTFLAAIKLKSSRMLLSCGPALITVLFAALSFLAIRLTLPYGDLIKGLVYPLPWFYHLGSSAGVIFMAGFITVVTAVLTILVFNNARTMFQAFFPGASAVHLDRKSIIVSASAIYGLAGAILNGNSSTSCYKVSATIRPGGCRGCRFAGNFPLSNGKVSRDFLLELLRLAAIGCHFISGCGADLLSGATFN